MSVVLVTDRYVRPADLVITALAVVALMAALWFAVRLLWPLRRIPSDRQVARYIEESCPGLEERLTSAADVLGRMRDHRVGRGHDTPGTDLSHLVVGDATRRARTIDLDRVVSRSHVRSAILRTTVAVLAFVVVSVTGSQTLQRIARVAWLYAFPASAVLVVEPGDTRVLAGEPVVVRALLEGMNGVFIRTPPALTLTVERGETRVVSMARIDRARVDGDSTRVAFETVLPAVDESFDYQVGVATLRSDRFSVTAFHPPHIERIDVRFEYPAFANLPPRVERDGGDVYAPAGTLVTVSIHSDKPVREGEVQFAGGSDLALRRVSEYVAEASFEVVADDTYRVRVVDTDGLSTPSGLDYFVRAVVDRPPVVDVVRPADDREITPLEEIVIEATAADDFGLERFELVWAVEGRRDRHVSLLSEPGQRQASGARTLYAEQLDVAPGDFISYYVRALDTNTGTGAGYVRSDLYFLEVRPFDREFEEAQSQLTSGREAGEIEDLAEVEKQIIIATWRVDGQPASDNRAIDVAAVADAQGELRWAAERAAQKILARGRPNTGNAGRTTGVEMEAMRDAIEAMREAEARLREDGTAVAITQEKEALNQLLRAEAEIRKHQVRRPENGSGGGQGGGGGAQEDLSALFDDELRRDQQTNYEDRPSTAAPRSEDADDVTDAQRRLEELAARQESLAREQEQLGAKGDDDGESDSDDDERKRQLERLTREQNQLRQELEEVARRLDRNPTDESNSASDSAQIAEEMRRAANDLRRGDPDQAAARGQDAARRLRALGRQLGGQSGTPESNDERVGRLQREAEQLADDERQLASEVRESEMTGPARRELSRRGEALADRVDALDRGVEGARSEVEHGQEALETASRELETSDVAARTRQLARRLRRPAGSSGSAEERDGARVAEGQQNDDTGVAERQDAVDDTAEGNDAGSVDDATQIAASAEELAEALQRVARQLSVASGESSAEDAALAGQLAGIRELEDRLDRLEQGQMPGGGSPGAAREDFARDLAETPGVLEYLGSLRPTAREDLDEWVRHWKTGAAPGTEAFKQDLAAWENLRVDVRIALERLEADHALARQALKAADRVTVGPTAEIPDAYRRLVESYYRSIATPRSRAGAVH